jgi:hypothetical protein
MECGDLKIRLLTSVIAQVEFPLGQELEIFLSWAHHFASLWALDFYPGWYYL